MVAAMAKQPKQARKPDGDEKQQVYTYVDPVMLTKFDELAESQHRSRAGMMAFLMEQFVDAEYPRLLAKRQGQGGA